ncbi:MAG TPA: mechanosensitive ion channel family protein [Candidatus Kapabacteria bacterium]|nr:mechanosensitive ion channel family protein [Candidatus Kapabacteria bacterium]
MGLFSVFTLSSIFTQYWNDLAEPLAIVAGALALGLLVERVGIVYAIKFFKQRERTERDAWRLGQRLAHSFNGIVTVWFGLAAFRSVLSEFPIKPAALPLIEHTASAILIVTIAVLCARLLIAFIRTYSTQHERAVQSITLVQNIVRTVIYIIAMLAILHAYGIAITPLLAALGVGGLAVALALQDTLSNFFAGIYIIISRHTDPGDYVKLDSGQEGIIRDIAWRVTTLVTPAGTLIIVPNSKFSTSIITNFDRPDRSVTVTIDLPLEQTMPAPALEHAAMEAANEAAAAMKGLAESAPTLQYTALSATGATLQLSIKINDFSRGSEIRHEILTRLYARLHPPPETPKE